MERYDLLKAEIVKTMRYRRISFTELARLTGYKLSTLRVFMRRDAANRSDSAFVANAIITALGLDFPLIATEGRNGRGKKDRLHENCNS